MNEVTMLRRLGSLATLLLGAVAFSQPIDVEALELSQVVTDAAAVRPQQLDGDRYVLIFTLLQDCAACDLLYTWLTEDLASLSNVIFVTNQDITTSSDAFVNLWYDPKNVLGTYFEVTEAPSVFLLDHGVVVAHDSWPFAQRREAITSTLRAYLLEELLQDAERDDLVELLGTTLPPHELITRDGRTVGADRLAEGGVIIFCSLACPVCLEEIEALQAALGGGGETAYDRIYMVLPSDTPSDGSWAEFPWTLLLDTNNHLAEALKVSATPTHFFLDEQGRIYDVKIGFGEGTTETIRVALGR